MSVHVWLRAETKANEARTALVPIDAKQLVDGGFQVSVEQSSQRIFSTDDYARCGCQVVPAGAWENASASTFVLGLKELPTNDAPLKQNHIYFAHAFKHQKGWSDLLGRFQRGRGKLLDLEYFTDDAGGRLIAFGYWAGFAGAVLAIEAWILQQGGNKRAILPAVQSVEDIESYFDQLNNKLDQFDHTPRSLIIGGAGRSGRGAADALHQLELRSTLWNRRRTAKGGPFEDILAFNILINCVFVNRKIAPFLTGETLKKQRQLSVITDVSCDPTGPFNTLPIYNASTSFDQPVQRLKGQAILDLISIDHLPSMFPKQSSEDFSNQLLPHLLDLKDGSAVLDRAEKCYLDALREI
jgi:hypothetical protein